MSPDILYCVIVWTECDASFQNYSIKWNFVDMKGIQRIQRRRNLLKCQSSECETDSMNSFSLIWLTDGLKDFLRSCCLNLTSEKWDSYMNDIMTAFSFPVSLKCFSSPFTETCSQQTWWLLLSVLWVPDTLLPSSPFDHLCLSVSPHHLCLSADRQSEFMPPTTRPPLHVHLQQQ